MDTGEGIGLNVITDEETGQISIVDNNGLRYDYTLESVDFSKVNNKIGVIWNIIVIKDALPEDIQKYLENYPGSAYEVNRDSQGNPVEFIIYTETTTFKYNVKTGEIVEKYTFETSKDNNKLVIVRGPDGQLCNFKEIQIGENKYVYPICNIPPYIQGYLEKELAKGKFFMAEDLRYYMLKEYFKYYLFDETGNNKELAFSIIDFGYKINRYDEKGAVIETVSINAKNPFVPSEIQNSEANTSAAAPSVNTGKTAATPVAVVTPAADKSKTNTGIAVT